MLESGRLPPSPFRVHVTTIDVDRHLRRDRPMLQPREFPETRASLLASLNADGVPRQAAWREFFERYAPAVYRVARLRGLGDSDADDVVQQVMLAVSSHIGGFEYDRDRGKFRQWVRAVTQSKLTDLHRRRQTRSVGGRAAETAVPLEDYADEEPGPNEQWEQEWRTQDMLYCLDQVAADISPRRMRAFRMYTLEGVSAAETAEQLGVTVGHIYVTRNHVLKLVRQRMEELEEGNEATRQRGNKATSGSDRADGFADS